MPDQSPMRKSHAGMSAVHTAVNMADAIAFLMRVADEAGFSQVAVRLAGIRASLLSPDLLPTREGDVAVRKPRNGRPNIDGDAHDSLRPSKRH
jgi:hypothetical protein